MQECPFGLSFAKCQFSPTIMPTMVSIQKNIERYHARDSISILLVISTLVALSLKVPVCARRSVLYVQRQCPGCGIQKQKEASSRHSTCRECRSVTSTSTANITMSIDLSSFQQFFDHDPSQGHPLSLIQRSSLLALHSLGLGDDLVAQLTGCARTPSITGSLITNSTTALKMSPEVVDRG